MNQIVIDVLFQMGAYIVVFVSAFFLFNKLMGGLLINWLKVRTGQNKKILVKVRTVIVDYYTAGFVIDGMVVFKDKAKAEKRLSLIKGSVYRSIGVNCVDIDEERNCVVLQDFSIIPGFDAEKHNSLYLRALYKPTINDQRLLIITIIIGVLLAILIMISIYMASRGNTAVLEQIASLKQITNTISAEAITGGV